MKKINHKSLYRIIDANYNRLKEGLRVCEDICRFIYDEKSLTGSFKAIRHEALEIVARLELKNLIASRNSEQDIGKETILTELKRDSLGDVFYANLQRVKESVRVLEELTKLFDKELAQRLKKMRYRIYGLEKKAVKKI